MGRLGGAPGASLFVLNDKAQYCTTSPEPQERAQRMINEGWLHRGRIIPALFAQRHAGFLIDVEFFSPEELAEEPIYRDMWRPQGVGWGMATAITLPTGENAMFVLSRRTEAGPFERAAAQRLDELRPHLARGVLISARLQLERARAASEALAAMRIPALVFGETGKVLSANSLIEATDDYVDWRAFDRASLKDPSADDLLRDAIAAIGSERQSSVRSFPVRDARANTMMVAHIIPIRLSARDLFLRFAAILTLTPVAPPQAPPIELIQCLFDLTPAEARVARSLATGQTVEDIASERRLSVNTVRTQVRGVLEKTGCNRQAEIIAILTGIIAPHGGRQISTVNSGRD